MAEGSRPCYKLIYFGSLTLVRVVHHNPQVLSSSFSLVAWPAPLRQSQAETKVGSKTQEVQERNSEGLGMGRHADSSRLSDINATSDKELLGTCGL